MFKKLANSKSISRIKRLRYLAAAIVSLSVLTLIVITIPVTRGANPVSGSVSESQPQVTWTGQVKVPTGDNNCGTASNAACDNFRIDFQAPSSSFGPYLLEIKLVPQGDWDIQVYGPSGNLLDGSGNSPGVLEIVTMINPPSGSYTVAAAPFAPLVGTDGNSYAASAELKHYFVNGAEQGPDTNINYHNFAATGNLGNTAGEPTIGVNWKTGRVMFIALEQTLRATFDDSTVPARATWEDKSFLWTNLITMDPILFTDSKTGRTIVSQLITPAAANGLGTLTQGCSMSAVTDDDGENWIPDEGCGPPSGADHQSIGGGPFADPLPRELPAPAYAHAMYYCAQSGVTAYCSRSDDGGVTFGPGVPIYTTECSGLHGHPSVGPDGTVYVPNRSCGGKQGVVVSENNGVSWSVRTLPDSIQGAMDPGVQVGAGNSVYFGYQNSDGHAKVAVSHDKGLNWTQSKDVGAAFGIKNTAFPRMMAGDDDRAAFAFLGTPTGGSFQDANFAGEWHLYIAHTFNSGETWTTIDATPTDPVQRGCIWMQGGSNPCRNLLDFMGSAVDKEGRVLVGYADGCVNCSGPSDSHRSKATIARQVNGRRLFAQYDPIGDPSPTPTPSPTVTPTPEPISNVLHFHGNPTDDSGFTGFGTADVVGAGGPFLDARTTLGTTAPGHWDVPDPVADGTADQNIYDPSWIWNLNSPVALNGDMTIKWWASCSGCSAAAGLPVDWDIRLWADGVKVFEKHVVNVTPSLPNVTELLQTTVTLPPVSAGTKYVLQIDPAFIDGQVNTHIYYDSQSACPGASGSAPCDSQVIMPIVGANPTPTPTPTPDASPSPTVSPTPTPTPTPVGSIPPARQDSGPKVGFENFTAPGVLTPALTTSAGQQVNSVEYLGRSSGEPSIGNNWKTGVTAYQSDLQTLFVTFNDSCSSAASSSTWVNRPAPTSVVINSDPIGFTDSQTGRTFAGELTLLSPTCKTSFTDNDGATWTPTQGSGIASGVDHQTIGGGPFAAPLTRPTDVPGLYPNAVYYCSQEGAPAGGPPSFCSRSDDGGLTFGPSVPLTTPPVNVCGGLHGHVKVGPDGAVYVPFNSCGGVGSLLVSLDNGVTWTIRHVESAGHQATPSLSFQDPAVAIDKGGRIYYSIADEDKAAAVLTSDDHGATWQNLGDVGAVYGLKNIRYPAAMAGDAGRAAVAFYGTTTPGDALQPSFDGLWHLYIAETFDGGQSWTTTDATPNAPIQRGCIWAQGGANICRNLLDFFDMTVDKEGRVLVGYVNGCEGANCAQAAATAKGNAYTAAAVIARQSSGRRLFAAYDPLNALTATSKPGMPAFTAKRVGSVVTLGWSLADTGNLPISSFKIMRSTSSGTETLLASVPGDQTSYTDTSATDTTKTYYYKVLAENGAGTSCGANEVAAPYIGDTCTGLVIHRNEPTHPEANLGMNTPASLLIDYIAVGEPAGTNNLMFRMKVNSLASIPANSRWRIAWNSFAAEAIDPDAQQFYVGMTTGPSGPPTFEYGTLADAGLPAVYAISETKRGIALAGSTFNADGTITIIVPKTALGNPQPGDLLGAVNGRTFTADVPGTPEALLERSNIMIDHTFVKAQTDNSYPAATYTVTGNMQCAATVEQVINSMVSMQASNPSSSGGKSSFDLMIKNISSQGIFTPMYLEVAQITSSSGTVTVANSDNGGTAAGAAWSYNTNLGADNILSPNEVSLPRNLKFNTPNNATFSVTFNVVGTIAQTSGASSGGGSSGGGSSGGTASTGGLSSVGGVTNRVFQVTYNPILRTVTIKLL
jgi:hypothetical protein